MLSKYACLFYFVKCHRCALWTGRRDLCCTEFGIKNTACCSLHLQIAFLPFFYVLFLYDRTICQDCHSFNAIPSLRHHCEQLSTVFPIYLSSARRMGAQQNPLVRQQAHRGPSSLRLPTRAIHEVGSKCTRFPSS